MSLTTLFITIVFIGLLKFAYQQRIDATLDCEKSK